MRRQPRPPSSASSAGWSPAAQRSGRRGHLCDFRVWGLGFGVSGFALGAFGLTICWYRMQVRKVWATDSGQCDVCTLVGIRNQTYAHTKLRRPQAVAVTS